MKGKKNRHKDAHTVLSSFWGAQKTVEFYNANKINMQALSSGTRRFAFDAPMWYPRPGQFRPHIPRFIMIALYYAMSKEIAFLLADAGESLIREEAGVRFYRIRDDLIAVAGGIGKVNAAMATQLCITLFHPDLIIDCGVAGCFENVPIGTVILADRFVQHDVDTTGCGDPLGLVSTINVIDFATSDLDAARRAMDAAHPGYLCGPGATGDWFAKAGDRAAAIRDAFHPLFIEMEGCAVAQVCLRNGTKFMAVKSVSDCLFGNDRYDFNFPDAMRDLHATVLRFVDCLKAQANP